MPPVDFSNFSPSFPGSSFAGGAKAMFRSLPGVFIFGMITGGFAADTGLPPLISFLLSMFLFTGPALIVSLDLLSSGDLELFVVLTGIAVNLPLLSHGATLGAHLSETDVKRRVFMGFLFSKESGQTALDVFEQSGCSVHKPSFYMGAALTVWGAWLWGTFAGIVLTDSASYAVPLDFAVHLTLLYLCASALRNRPFLTAAAVAGIAAVLFSRLPYRAEIWPGAFCGISAGFLMLRYLQRRVDASIAREEKPDSREQDDRHAQR